jgi:hypothetical protein
MECACFVYVGGDVKGGTREVKTRLSHSLAWYIHHLLSPACRVRAAEEGYSYIEWQHLVYNRNQDEIGHGTFGECGVARSSGCVLSSYRIPGAGCSAGGIAV